LQHFNLRDHKLWYYFAGVISSLSILIERKSRRSELALYAFPRAMDSLYMILYDHQLAFRVPQGEMLLFCSAMASVMYCYENESECLSPLVAKLLDRFLPRKSRNHLALKLAVPPPPPVSDAEDSDSRVRFADSPSISSSGDDADDETDGAVGLQPSDRNKSVLSLSGGYQIAP